MAGTTAQIGTGTTGGHGVESTASWRQDHASARISDQGPWSRACPAAIPQPDGTMRHPGTRANQPT